MGEKGYITPKRKDSGHRRYTFEQLKPFISSKSDNELKSTYPQEHEVPVAIDDKKQPLLSIQDFDDQRLIPIKSQIKALEHTISHFKEREGILLLIINMLLLIILRLLYIANCPTNLIMNATLLHCEFTDHMSTLEKVDNPESRIVENDVEVSDKTMLKAQQTTNLRKKDTIWKRAKDHASKVFLALSKASVDQSLDQEERRRANDVVNKILGPYQRATSNLSEYEPGTVNHDVAALLLFHQPTDFGINRDRWSVRTLSKICKTNLETRACSRSQVHRVLQQLRWNCAKRSR